MNETAISLIKKAQELEAQGNFWEAGEEYKDALLELNRFSDFKDEKALCKKKIREMNIKRADDFVESSASYTFSQDEAKILDDLVNSYVNCEELADCLYKIGIESHFRPDYKKIELSSRNENMPLFFILANLSSQDDQGNLSQDGHDPIAMSFAMNYSSDHSGIMQIYLRNIFARLMKTKMTAENLANYFESKKVFSDDTLAILRIGIERYFAEDYVSSLHILVSRFEGAFLELTESISEVDIVASRKQSGSADQVWTQDKTLGEPFLKDEDVRKVWGEDFCEQVLFTMFSPLGYKIRHKVAHGYIGAKDLNFANCTLLLYFFLVMATKADVNNN